MKDFLGEEKDSRCFGFRLDNGRILILEWVPPKDSCGARVGR